MTQLDCMKIRNAVVVKLSERSRRIIHRMSLRNRTMFVRSITGNFKIQRTEHTSRDTVTMRDIVQFALGRLLGIIRKFMYGDASHRMASEF